MAELSEQDEDVLIDSILNSLKDNGKIIDNIINKSEQSEAENEKIQSVLNNNNQ